MTWGNPWNIGVIVQGFTRGTPDFSSRHAIVTQADTGTTQHIPQALLLHQGGNTRPQQHDDRPVAVIGMDTGTTNLGHSAAIPQQRRNIEFRLRVITTRLDGIARRKEAVGTHHAP